MPTSPDPGPSPGQDEAMAGLVHDLRTPVMIVSAFADPLQRRDDLTPQQRAEFVERIAEAADELRRLLDAADAADAAPRGSASVASTRPGARTRTPE